MLSTIATAFITAIIAVLTFLVGLLPSFDWPDLASQISNSGALTYVAYLNWFFPVSQALSVTALWAAAILVYKAYLMFTSWFQAWSTKFF